MSKKATWLSLSVLIVMSVLVISFGCTAPSPTPAPAPSPKPAPTTAPVPTATATPSPIPTPTASPKPTTTAAAPYFKGKTLTLVVPFSPGGGTDLVARLWARYLTKFIPGNPNVIVNNMPGAGSLIGSNYAYNAKPDGTTILVGAGGDYMGSLFKLPEAKYDYRNMTLVIADMGGLIWYAKPGNVATPFDLAKPKTPWIFGTTSTGFYVWLYTLFNEIMPIPTEKVLAVYTGAAASRMALFSGEINMTAESVQAYRATVIPFVQKGDVMPLFTTGVLDASGKMVRDPLTPDMPTFAELVERITNKPIPSGKALEAMKAIMAAFSYLHRLALPPRVPDEVVKILWDAASQMIKDPAYLKDAEPLGAAPPFVWAGETVAKAFKSQFGMTDETTKWIMDLVWEKYHIKPAG